MAVSQYLDLPSEESRNAQIARLDSGLLGCHATPLSVMILLSLLQVLLTTQAFSVPSMILEGHLGSARPRDDDKLSQVELRMPRFHEAEEPDYFLDIPDYFDIGEQRPSFGRRWVLPCQ